MNITIFYIKLPYLIWLENFPVNTYFSVLLEFFTSLFEALSEDPDRELLSRLLNAWQSSFENIPSMVRDAVNKAENSHNKNNELKEILYLSIPLNSLETFTFFF